MCFAIKNEVKSLLDSNTATKTMFDDAMKSTYYLMKNDSFARFTRKKEFVDMLQKIKENGWDFDLEVAHMERCLKSGTNAIT